MKRLVPLALLGLLVIAIVPGGSARAQTASDESALSEIAAALTRIAEAMERQLDGGRLDLLMRQVETRQRQLNLIENQLRSAERERDGYLQTQTRLEMEVGRMTDRELAVQMGYDPASLDLQVESMEFELGMNRQRLAELDQRIARLEEDRARRQREVDDWQAFLDRELSGAP